MSSDRPSCYLSLLFSVIRTLWGTSDLLLMTGIMKIIKVWWEVYVTPASCRGERKLIRPGCADLSVLEKLLLSDLGNKIKLIQNQTGMKFVERARERAAGWNCIHFCHKCFQGRDSGEGSYRSGIRWRKPILWVQSRSCPELIKWGSARNSLIDKPKERHLILTIRWW